MSDDYVPHAWLDLLDVDGPFLSRPALTEQLDRAWPPRLGRDIRDIVAPTAHEPSPDWSDLEANVNRLLTDVLGYRPGRTITFDAVDVQHAHHPRASVRVHAVCHPSGKSDAPRMVVISADDTATTPQQFDPTHRHDDHNWRATPVQRAALASSRLGAELALVTDGLRHLIVWVGSGVTGSAWIDPAHHRLDRQLADAFVALLKADRVCAQRGTTTAKLLHISQDKQADLTGELGIQVRAAAEALVNAISRTNRDNDGALLKDIEAHDVYRGVVTVLMRTVFLLNAEERGLIGDEDGMWADAYGVSTLLDQLDDDRYRHAGVMRRRHGAWLRLLAAARAVHGGVDHDAMSTYSYGGGLFDPDAYPFLEGITPDGTDLSIGVVDDYTVHHVLDLLQRLDGQRLSYRSFSVEQIGHVYEHLLDHDAVTVPDNTVVLGLVGAKGNEAEVPLSDLENNHDTDKKLATWIADTHDPSSGKKTKIDKWLGRIQREPSDEVAASWRQALNNDPDLVDRVQPYIGLLDTDARGNAKVFLPSDIYVTETSSRRDSGTSYTSPEFAAEIAKHTLRHLVYEVELESDEDPSTGLKHPDDLLKLKVCDPAVGSGAIIVAAVRYLADRLVDARIEHGASTTRGTAAARSVDTDAYVQAARDVVASCIYAVDRDPMAVEMTKLSLWLITMAKDRPFSFVDHAIRSGDALLGITDLKQLRQLHLRTDTEGNLPLTYGAYLEKIDQRITEALDLRAQIRAGDVLGPDDAARRAATAARADQILDGLRAVADAITAVCYRTATESLSRTDEALYSEVQAAVGSDDTDTLRKVGATRPDDCAANFEFFHWALEFPEVLRDGGFDGLVGNPPFQGGKKIRGALGASYREHIIRYCASGDSGSADLVSYFFRRGSQVGRSLGFIATNTIAQGDSRRVGLLPLSGQGEIHRADPSERWPGRDAVHVAKVWWTSEPPSRRTLESRDVPGIESDLWPTGSTRGEPYRLPNNRGIATAGQYVLGAGFVLDEQAVEELLAVDERNADVIDKYISGSDVNSSPIHDSDRWVINFHDWSIDRASEYRAVYEVAESDIKPQRDKVRRKQYRERWWRYAEYRPELVKRLDGLRRTIVLSRVSGHVIPAMRHTNAVFSEACVLFTCEDEALFGVLTSTLHRVWVDRYTSTMKSDIRYSPTDCFETLPMPGVLSVSDSPSEDGLVAHEEKQQSMLDQIVNWMSDLDRWRSQEMLAAGHGLTKLYGRYHDPAADDPVAAELRERHVELDRLVCSAYGWNDLKLEHGFHETRHGTFFTVSTEARFELLMRLLERNFEQYAEQTGRPLEQVVEEAQQHG